MPLEDYHQRLHEHYAALAQSRPRGCVYGIEHGLTPAKLDGLQQCFADEPGAWEEWWLPLIAWGSECGYHFAGNFWTPFFEPFGGPGGHGPTPAVVVQRFEQFANEQVFRGARPFPGNWEQNFPNICWPLSNAIVPQSIAVHLVQDLLPLLGARPDLLRQDAEEIVAWIQQSAPPAGLAEGHYYLAFRSTQAVLELAVRFALDHDLDGGHWLEEQARTRIATLFDEVLAPTADDRAEGGAHQLPAISADLWPVHQDAGWTMKVRLEQTQTSKIEVKRSFGLLLRGATMTLGGIPLGCTAHEALTCGREVLLQPWHEAFAAKDARFGIEPMPGAPLTQEHLTFIDDLLTGVRLPRARRRFGGAEGESELSPLALGQEAAQMVLWSMNPPTEAGWQPVDAPPLYLWAGRGRSAEAGCGAVRQPPIWAIGRPRPHNVRAPIELVEGLPAVLGVRPPGPGTYVLRLCQGDLNLVSDPLHYVPEVAPVVFATLEGLPAGGYRVTLARDGVARPIASAGVFVSPAQPHEPTALATWVEPPVPQASTLEDLLEGYLPAIHACGPAGLPVDVSVELRQAHGLMPPSYTFTEQLVMGDDQFMNLGPLLEGLLATADGHLGHDTRSLVIRACSGGETVDELVFSRSEACAWVCGEERTAGVLRVYSDPCGNPPKVYVSRERRPWDVMKAEPNVTIEGWGAAVLNGEPTWAHLQQCHPDYRPQDYAPEAAAKSFCAGVEGAAHWLFQVAANCTDPNERREAVYRAHICLAHAACAARGGSDRERGWTAELAVLHTVETAMRRAAQWFKQIVEPAKADQIIQRLAAGPSKRQKAKIATSVGRAHRGLARSKAWCTGYANWLSSICSGTNPVTTRHALWYLVVRPQLTAYQGVPPFSGDYENVRHRAQLFPPPDARGLRAHSLSIALVRSAAIIDLASAFAANPPAARCYPTLWVH